MQLLVSEFHDIEKALRLLESGEAFKALPIEKQDIIIKADLALISVYRRRKNDNKRMAERVAKRRKIDKNYGR